MGLHLTDADIQFRIALHELWKEAGNEVGRNSRKNSHTESATQRMLFFIYRRLELLGMLQDFPPLVNDVLTDGGREDRLPLAVEDLHSQLFFELLYHGA